MPAPDFAYRGQKIANTHLKYDVFVTPSIPVVTTDFAPGEHERPWPPISSTMIYGSRDAVVVDSFISLEQARAQADWIASTGKNLTTIYATHGHGDHFFGASVLLERFPKAHFVAAPSAIQVMKEQTSPEFVAKFWKSRFPNQLPKRLVVAQEGGRPLNHSIKASALDLDLWNQNAGPKQWRRDEVSANAEKATVPDCASAFDLMNSNGAVFAGSAGRNTGELLSPHFAARCWKSTGGSFG
jgi:hypothetical protein